MTTEHSLHNTELGNTKPIPATQRRSRGWCFTLNNYSEQEYASLESMMHTHTLKFVMGKEVGKQGTPHLQGYCYFKNGKTLTSMKLYNSRCHWEPAKGSPEANFKYCSKDDEYICNGWEKKISFQDKIKSRLLEQYAYVQWKPWQQSIIDLVNSPADSRTINWVYDSEGNSGKSFLTKYLCLTREVIIADGKKDNVMNQVKVKLIDEEVEFDTVILDVPRHNEGYVSYGVLEQLKNGLIYSGKYEGGMCLFDHVHVVVFANFWPDESKFSEDRWNIIDVSGQE